MASRKHISSEREQLISILIIVVSVLIFIGIAVYFICFGEKKEDISDIETMPNIIGYSIKDVEGCYSRYFELDVTDEEYSDYKKGTILSQSIPAKQTYHAGKTVVQIVVSAGKEPVVTTTAPVETTVAETEPVLETGLTVDSPAMSFEQVNESNDPRKVITLGIDENDAEIKAKLDELFNVLNPKGCDGGYLYVDLESGASAEFNAEEKFSAASIVKAPYARAVLGKETDLTRKFVMSEDMLNSPSEFVNGQPVGTEFTTEELIRATLSKSDNTAYKMLYANIGFDCFNELSSSLKLPQKMTEENYWFRMTPRETAVYFKDIYYFMENHENGTLMKDSLLNAEHNDLINDELTEYDVCEKYGYIQNEGFYTLGAASVVYAEHPYVLVIYVRGTGTTLNTKFFHDISRLTDDLSKLIHS